MTTAAPRICPSCRVRQEKWLYETSPSTHVRTGLRFQSHSTRDDTPAGVRDNREARYQDWRQLVDFQCQLVADICAKEQHLADELGRAA